MLWLPLYCSSQLDVVFKAKCLDGFRLKNVVLKTVTYISDQTDIQNVAICRHVVDPDSKDYLHLKPTEMVICGGFVQGENVNDCLVRYK